jgi:hypothetical protein
MGTSAVETPAAAPAHPLLIPRAMPSHPAMIATFAAVLALAGARPAVASPTARITSLVAGAREMFALRANTVVTLDAGGRELARCSRFAATPPERAAARPVATVDADAALQLAGLPDDEPDSAEAEDALADEGLAPRRRAAPAPAAPIVAHALAASPTADDVWIATSAGLYRGSDGSCARVALPGRDVVAVAAGAAAVAVATQDRLWRSGGDGSFTIAAGLLVRPRALAVVDGEHTLVASKDGIIEIGPHAVGRAVLDRGSDALVVCGGVALAFAGDGVWTWIGEAPARRVGDRPPTAALACGDTPGARFIATGGGVYTSADGAVWRPHGGPPGESIRAATAIAGRIWVAVEDDLVALDDAPPASFSPGTRPASPPALLPLATRRLLEPAFPWPQLTLVLAGQRTPLREGWSLVVLLAFPLGRPPAPGGRRQLAAELVRRDAALAAEEHELSVARDDDPSRTARLRATRQEREALR